MAGRVEARLAELGIELPKAAGPAANYVPFAVSGSTVFISGQVPVTADGLQYRGKLGADYGVEEGQAAARLCGLNILAQVREACDGDLDRVARCLRLEGFVNAMPEFEQHPAVINGASDLIVEVLGEPGRHSRFAVGCSSLPFNVAVEVGGIFEIS